MKSFRFLLVVCFLLLLSPVAWGNPNVVPEEYQLSLYRARVVEITEVRVDPFGGFTTQVAVVEVLNKDYRGHTTQIRSTLSGDPTYDTELRVGTVVSIHLDRVVNGEPLFFLMGYDRTSYVFYIIGLFFVCLVAIGGVKGIKALVALGVILSLLFFGLIPLLLKGWNPILVSVGVCTLSTVLTLVIIAGWSYKSKAAIIGTIGGISIGGGVAYAFGHLAKLTGFDTAEAQMLMYIPQEITLDFRGLLFAGILIGALGAAMDVSISIASALEEISSKDARIAMRELIKHGLNIGKDIMGTMANTLILAYTGGTLSMMLVFVAFQKSVGEIINLDSVATEIVRAMAGSVGLVFAVPLTAISYAFLVRRRIVKADQTISG